MLHVLFRNKKQPNIYGKQIESSIISLPYTDSHPAHNYHQHVAVILFYFFYKFYIRFLLLKQNPTLFRLTFTIAISQVLLFWHITRHNIY